MTEPLDISTHNLGVIAERDYDERQRLERERINRIEALRAAAQVMQGAVTVQGIDGIAISAEMAVLVEQFAKLLELGERG